MPCPHARTHAFPLTLAPPLIACTLSPSLCRLLQVGAMSADGSISARAIVTTELVSEATELQGLGKVP
jgi:hypothetical protein